MTPPPPMPPGFPEHIPHSESLTDLHEVMVRCTRCDLFQGRTLVVPGSGPERAAIFFVGEAPGAREDAEGRPFVGRSGDVLDAMLMQAGLERADVFIANVVRCRPPGNRNPRATEIRACAGWLRTQLRLVHPRIVVPLGRVALQHFLPGASVTELQGAPTPVDYDGRTLTLFPIFHPSAILRDPRKRDDYAAHFRGLAELAREG